MEAADWTITNGMVMLTVIFAFYLPEFLAVRFDDWGHTL